MLYSRVSPGLGPSPSDWVVVALHVGAWGRGREGGEVE